MLMEPDLGTLDGFAATVKLIAAVEFPLIGVVEVPLGVVTVIHGAWLTADHKQPGCVVSVILLLTALLLNESEPDEYCPVTAKGQLACVCTPKSFNAWYS